MNQHKTLLARYLRISEYFKKPLPYSFVKRINAPKAHIPKSHKLINGYILPKNDTLPGNLHEITRKKVKRARKLLWLLWLLPFIRMIGLSGSVATGTPDPLDDIDVIIITDSRALWLTRLLDNAIFRMLKVRRTAKTKKGKEKDLLCINTYITNNYLNLRNEDIFSAFQLLSIIPLYGETMYYKLLKSNNWLNKFTYRDILSENQTTKISLVEVFRAVITIATLPIIFIIEPIAKYVQQRSFAKHPGDLYFYNDNTIETYPQSTRLKVLKFVSGQKSS